MHFIGGSLGAFGGTEEDFPTGGGSVSAVVYEFSRTATGWGAISLAPPASKYRSAGMFDASADLTGTLWELGKRKVSAPGEPQSEPMCPLRPLEEEAQPEGIVDFYIEKPRGTFTRVGPATPDPCKINMTHYNYLGASETLSHILFSSGPGFRWPFDKTASTGGTLYEYSGVEQSGETREPLLVGVSGGRDSTALISKCGTRLGSSALEEEQGGSVYNAISNSGARVFFTAVGEDEPGCSGEAPPVGELFAREEESASHWDTVAISEPLKEDCQACLTSGALKDATFQGASLDGSRVFFTTEQELLPGAVGTNLYEYDFTAPAGDKITRVSGAVPDPEVQGVSRISEDGSHVYFVARGKLTEEPDGVGDSARAEADNLYVYERDNQFPFGHTSFVATLSLNDASEWGRIDIRPVLSSYDGGIFVFTSSADLTDEGLSGQSQVFQYDATTGSLIRASIGQNGYGNDGRTPLAGSQIASHLSASYGYSRISSPATTDGAQAAEDGAVFFESPDALTPQALSDQRDSAGALVPNVYEYRAGSVYLLSDGRDVSTVSGGPGVYLAGSDASGDNVFFLTSDSLVPQDGDTQQDLYDARVDGGLSMPTPPSACAGEACRGTLAGAPGLAPLGGSATQVAEAEGSTTISAPVKVGLKPKVKKNRMVRKQKAKKGRKTAKKASGAKLHRHVYGGAR